jgi:hypothetical protein
MTRPEQKVLFCALLIAITTACGAPGVPLPPSLQLASPVTDLKATRKADKVYLSWTVPARNTDGLRIRELGKTQICRSTDPLVVAKDCDTPVGSVAPPAISVSPRKGQSPAKIDATYVDTLQPSQLSGDRISRISYAVSVLNDRSRSAGLSNQVQVPALPVLPPPTGLDALPAAEGIVLTWNPVQQPSGIASLTHIYRAYRRETGGTNDAVVGELSGDTAQPRLVDHSFEWEKTYEYRVTVVTQVLGNGRVESQVEGEDTPSVRVFAHDIFPPAVPSGLQAVYSSTGNQSFIDLIWTPDFEADLAGYDVYRRQEGSGNWTRINSRLIGAPAYRDDTVRHGTTYWYAVSAVDVRQNESAKSDAAREQTP